MITLTVHVFSSKNLTQRDCLNSYLVLKFIIEYNKYPFVSPYSLSFRGLNLQITLTFPVTYVSFGIMTLDIAINSYYKVIKKLEQM